MKSHPGSSQWVRGWERGHNGASLIAAIDGVGVFASDAYRRCRIVEPVHWHQTPTIATEIPRNGGLVATVSVIGLMQRGPVLASLAPYGIRPHRSKSGKRRIFRYRSVPADASRH